MAGHAVVLKFISRIDLNPIFYNVLSKGKRGQTQGEAKKGGLRQASSRNSLVAAYA
jgi:hypothetical protein